MESLVPPTEQEQQFQVPKTKWSPRTIFYQDYQYMCAETVVDQVQHVELISLGK